MLIHFLELGLRFVSDNIYVGLAAAFSQPNNQFREVLIIDNDVVGVLLGKLI